MEAKLEWVKTVDQFPPAGKGVLGCYESRTKEQYFRVVFYFQTGDRWAGVVGTRCPVPDYWSLIEGPS